MMAMSHIFPFDGAVPDFGASVQAEQMVGNHPDIQISYVSEFHIDLCLPRDHSAGIQRIEEE